MEQQLKRFKPTTRESIVSDIASSIDHIATSVKSMSDSYAEILRANKTVVTYLRDAEKRKVIDVDVTIANLERSSIRENH